MNTYTHKNIEITFEPASARFSATLPNKKRLWGPSLESLKKKIDEALKAKFEPFNALIWERAYHNRGASITEVRVIRVEKAGRGKWDHAEFIIENKDGTSRSYNRHRALSPSTPEARKAIEEYQALTIKNEKLIKELNEQTNKARERIPEIRAGDYT